MKQKWCTVHNRMIAMTKRAVGRAVLPFATVFCSRRSRQKLYSSGHQSRIRRTTLAEVLYLPKHRLFMHSRCVRGATSKAYGRKEKHEKHIQRFLKQPVAASLRSRANNSQRPICYHSTPYVAIGGPSGFGQNRWAKRFWPKTSMSCPIEGSPLSSKMAFLQGKTGQSGAERFVRWEQAQYGMSLGDKERPRLEKRATDRVQPPLCD